MPKFDKLIFILMNFKNPYFYEQNFGPHRIPFHK